MPTITLNRKVVEKLVGRKLSLEQLKDRIALMGTDLESIDDENIHVEVFPNRPDMLSERGFSRAFSTFIGASKGLRRYSVKSSGVSVIVEKSAAEARPFTACALVKGLKLDDEKIKEIIQIQEKLHITYGRQRRKVAIGIYPLEKITFPVKFIALPPEQIRFRPLDSSREMTAKQILIEHTAGKEYGKLLEEKKKFPLFIDSAGKVLSMPPIINAHELGRVEIGTNDLFIECSGFNLPALQTCLNIIVAALADMGGQIFSVNVKYEHALAEKKSFITPDLEPRRMDLDISYADRLLGLRLSEKEGTALLERMGYGSEKGKILVPAYRADILHQRDLVEDIAIAYGYENVKEELSSASTVGKEDALAKLRALVSNLLVGLGMQEVNTYHLIEHDAQILKMNLNPQKNNPVMLIDPVSKEYNSLRMSMLPSLLSVISTNKHNELPQHIFDSGIVFSKDSATETGVAESLQLGICMCDDSSDFTSIKQAVDYLFRMLGLSYIVAVSENPSFAAGRACSFSIGKSEIGVCGEISPAVLENFGIEHPVVAAILDVPALLRFVRGNEE
ncbi:MAG TPA: phenylalanine--tRNA ligase subunit beta [Candidatus Nanoarchaeia archaeon]|nr:phenylalanine--tRNA ligase subunit beta [Candidatus Nanoarchaeia archaeon]